MLAWDTLSLAILGGVLFARAAPPLEVRQDISILTPAQVTGFKPYSYYASTAYCKPSATLAWNCGSNCNSNPGFKPVASGGDGALVQYWYVGYDPALQTVIVAHQGTDASKVLPIVTDADLVLDDLEKSLFPEISSSVKVHNGFGEAQERSANAVLAAVKTAFSKYSTNKVTLVGHSLGGAIALISSIHLKLRLPAGTVVKTITYGMPRVGNQAFADYVDANLDLARVNNKRDLVPTLPGRFLGFHHARGEHHIQSSGIWALCPGQDNTSSQCTIGYVPNIFAGNAGDHNGPFDGVEMGC